MTDEKKPPVVASLTIICAGVDVMADRIEVATYAFPPGAFASELRSRITLWGDPFQNDIWQGLLMLLRAPVYLPALGFIGITAAAIDSGGQHTQQVYRFAHQYAQGHPSILATKCRSQNFCGAGAASAMVDVRYQGHPSASLRLFFVDAIPYIDNEEQGLAVNARFAYDLTLSRLGAASHVPLA